MKLAGQIVAATVVTLSGITIGAVRTLVVGDYLSLGWIDYPLTVLYLVVFVNITNLIDGLDGLASGLVAIVAGGLLYLVLMRGSFTLVLVCLALIAVLICICACLNGTVNCHHLALAEVFAYKIRSAAPSDNINEISLTFCAGLNIGAVYRQREAGNGNIARGVAKLRIGNQSAHNNCNIQHR